MIENQKVIALGGNRTPGSSMATTNFTTKPLTLTVDGGVDLICVYEFKKWIICRVRTTLGLNRLRSRFELFEYQLP